MGLIALNVAREQAINAASDHAAISQTNSASCGVKINAVASMLNRLMLTLLSRRGSARNLSHRRGWQTSHKATASRVSNVT